MTDDWQWRQHTPGTCPLCGCNPDILLAAMTEARAAWRGEHKLNLDLTARINHLVKAARTPAPTTEQDTR